MGSQSKASSNLSTCLHFGVFHEFYHRHAFDPNRRKIMRWISNSCFQTLNVSPSWFFIRLKFTYWYVIQMFRWRHFGEFCPQNRFDAIESNRRKIMRWIWKSCFQSLNITPSWFYSRPTLCTVSIIRIMIRTSHQTWIYTWITFRRGKHNFRFQDICYVDYKKSVKTDFLTIR